MMSWRHAITTLIAALLAACTDLSSEAASREAPSGTTSQSATERPTLSAARAVMSAAQPPVDVLTALGPSYASANIDSGRRIWSRCSSCHSLDGSPSPLPGPDLQNILGTQVGAQPGFGYSAALREADFIWTAERLDAWLTSPAGFLEGNAMSFSGVSEPLDRRDLIACIAVGQRCLDGPG